MVKVVDEIRVVGFGHPMVGVLPSTPVSCDGKRDFLWEWWWSLRMGFAGGREERIRSLRMGFAEGREERIRRRRRYVGD